MRLVCLPLVLAALIGWIAPSPVAAQDAAGEAATPLPKGTAAALPATPPVAVPAAGQFVRPLILPSPPQSYASFTSGAQRQSGLIDLLRKDDEVYFDLSEEQLGKTYIIAPSIASGIGNVAFAGRVYAPLIVRFERVGKRILWVEQNTNFIAPPNSAESAALDVSTADSIVATSPIVAQDASKKRVVIAAGLLLTDLEGIGAELGRAVTPPALPSLFSITVRPSFTLDASRSFFLRSKALPANDELLVNLTFSGPPGSVSAVPDSKGVPIHVHYSVIEAPHDGYVPRLADDRVGYFLTVHKRLGDPDRDSPFVRYIDRRNLANGPAVFYLTKEIPAEYRDAVRRGILGWNAAFARIGIPHALEVKDAPDDPNWDPDDVRYSVVRWISSDRPAFGGVSTSLVDPRTGEILRSEVVIEGDAIRSIRRGYMQVVAPTQFGASPAALSGCADEDCTFEWEDAQQAAIGTLEMRLMMHPTPKQLDGYVQTFVTSLVLHETGHALGLRHNFEAHTAYTMAELRDPAFTQSHGISASVMDYNAINLAPAGKPQGAYFQTIPGVYDNWAIEYGYKAFLPNVKDPAAELPALHRLAAESTKPGLRFATDDDASGAGAIDPRVGPFALSSDPIGNATQAMGIDSSLISRLTHLSTQDAQSYADERAAFLTIMSSYAEHAFHAAQYIGGMYSSRAHRGQSGGEPPFRPIPRSEQQRAFGIIARHILSAQALAFSPRLLNDLGPERFIHWDSPAPSRPDFPITRFVGAIQDQILAKLFDPLVMSRLSDQAEKAAPGSTMSLGDLFEWTRAAVWDDAKAPPSGSIVETHRELQRRYADLMAAIALLPASGMEQLGIPYDAQSMARHELRVIGTETAQGLRQTNLDLETRAHLENVAVRVKQALQAITVRPI